MSSSQSTSTAKTASSSSGELGAAPLLYGATRRRYPRHRERALQLIGQPSSTGHKKTHDIPVEREPIGSPALGRSPERCPIERPEAYDLGVLERVGLMRSARGSYELTEAGRRHAKVDALKSGFRRP